MAPSPSPEAPPTRSRSKRRKGRKPTTVGTISDILRRKMAVRVIAGAVAAVGALAFYMVWADYEYNLNTYLSLSLKDDQHSVLYAIGYPAAVRETPTSAWVKTGLSAEDGIVPGAKTEVIAGRPIFDYGQWAYVMPLDGEAQFTFDKSSSAVVRIACFQLQAQSGSCPPLMKVQVGDPEEKPYQKMGLASSEHISGMSKIVRYDKLGVQYAMAQRKVYRVELTKRDGDVVSYWAQFLRWAIF